MYTSYNVPTFFLNPNITIFCHLSHSFLHQPIPYLSRHSLLSLLIPVYALFKRFILERAVSP